MKKLKITYVYIVALAVIIIVAAILFFSLQDTVSSFESMQQKIDTYSIDQSAFNDVKEASSYLTNEARYFVTTGDKSHVANYMNEVKEVKRRDNALAVIKEHEGESELYQILENATSTSNELMLTEIYAFQLAANAYGVDLSEFSLEEYDVTLSSEDLALTLNEQRDKAVDLMFNNDYTYMKSIIEDNVYAGVEEIVNNTRSEVDARSAQTHRLLVREHVLMIVLIILMILTVILTFVFLIMPIRRNIQCIREDKPMPDVKIAELGYLADAYNTLHKEHASDISQLSYEASHDGLTGIYNRKVFEEELVQLQEEEIALMLIDVDYFKSINDTYGHDVGDLVLKKVAEVMQHSFRSNDFVFRLGGDEFAVILINMRHEYQTVLLRKIQNMRDQLKEPGDIPAVTLSIGVAFNADAGEEPLFKKADRALYVSKENGRNRTSFYDPSIVTEEPADA